MPDIRNIQFTHSKDRSDFETSLHEIALRRNDQEVTGRIQGFLTDNVDWIASRDLRSEHIQELDLLIQALPEEGRSGVLRRISHKSREIFTPEAARILHTGEYSNVTALKIDTENLPLGRFFKTIDEAIDFAIANRLSYVDLSDFGDIDNEIITKLAEGHSEIHTLVLFASPMWGTVSEAGIRAITENLRNLANLSINGCQNILDRDFQKIGKNLSRLTSLTLIDLPENCERGLRQMFQGLHQLKSLTLQSYRGLFSEDTF